MPSTVDTETCDPTIGKHVGSTPLVHQPKPGRAKATYCLVAALHQPKTVSVKKLTSGERVVPLVQLEPLDRIAIEWDPACPLRVPIPRAQLRILVDGRLETTEELEVTPGPHDIVLGARHYKSEQFPLDSRRLRNSAIQVCLTPKTNVLVKSTEHPITGLFARVYSNAGDLVWQSPAAAASEELSIPLPPRFHEDLKFTFYTDKDFLHAIPAHALKVDHQGSTYKIALGLPDAYEISAAPYRGELERQCSLGDGRSCADLAYLMVKEDKQDARAHAGSVQRVLNRGCDTKNPTDVRSCIALALYSDKEREFLRKACEEPSIDSWLACLRQAQRPEVVGPEYFLTFDGTGAQPDYFSNYRGGTDAMLLVTASQRPHFYGYFGLTLNGKFPEPWGLGGHLGFSLILYPLHGALVRENHTDLPDTSQVDAGSAAGAALTVSLSDQVTCHVGAIAAGYYTRSASAVTPYGAFDIRLGEERNHRVILRFGKGRFPRPKWRGIGPDATWEPFLGLGYSWATKASD